MFVRHFKQLAKQKRRDPNYMLKENHINLKIIERKEHKDVDDTCFEFSADQYYHETKVNESNKQTWIARHIAGMIEIERSMRTRKTVDKVKYTEFFK